MELNADCCTLLPAMNRMNLLTAKSQHETTIKKDDLHRPERSLQPSINKFSTQEFFDLMKYERLRLITYILLGHQWPLMDQVSPSLLAKAGFFYLVDDKVQCAFCKGILGQWSKDDCPMEEHRRKFPNCTFVTGELSGNTPLERDSSLADERNSNPWIETNPGQEPIKIQYNKSPTPRYPMFADVSKRELSFNRPNWTSQLDKKRFIDAGFFYTGKDDQTTCYHCGGHLYNWKPEEIPMEEHAFFFPECNFVIKTKGVDYLEFIKFKKDIIDMRCKMDSPEPVKAKDIDCMRKISFENFKHMKQSALRLFAKLGETEEEDEKYFQDYCRRSSFFVDCQKLFQMLLKMHFMKPLDSSRTNDNQHESSLSNSSVFSLPESSDSDYSSSNSDCEDYWSSDSMTADKHGKQSKSSLECLICCENQIEVVFLPCGHQLSCLKCSAEIHQCPVCRTSITSKIRTYFASLS